MVHGGSRFPDVMVQGRFDTYIHDLHTIDVSFNRLMQEGFEFVSLF